MKAFIPRNIAKWWFNMNFQIWPINVTLVQLVVLAIGIAIALVVWNAAVRAGAGKGIATVFALPVFIVFVVIAFFNISEMWVTQFIAKIIRTNMLDTPRKFQDDYERIDPAEVAIKMSKGDSDQKKTNVLKDDDINEAKLDKLKEDSIF